MLFLDKAERFILKTFPPGEIEIGSEQQFELRLAIAKKIHKHKVLDDASLSAELRELCERYPPWAFYQTVEGELPRRVFGILLKRSDEGATVPMLLAMAPCGEFVKEIVGGIACDSVTRVDSWAMHHDHWLSSCVRSNLFYDPLAYLRIVHDREWRGDGTASDDEVIDEV